MILKDVAAVESKHTDLLLLLLLLLLLFFINTIYYYYNRGYCGNGTTGCVCDIVDGLQYGGEYCIVATPVVSAAFGGKQKAIAFSLYLSSIIFSIRYLFLSDY